MESRGCNRGKRWQAMQQGPFAASLTRARLVGRVPPAFFHYRHNGSLATIGRGRAVAEIGPVRIGLPSWPAWLGIHLTYLGRRRDPGDRALALDRLPPYPGP